VTPAVLWGPRLFLDLTSPFRPGVGLVGLDVRAGIERANRDNVAGTTGHADFTLTVGVLEVCPLRLAALEFSFLPCARLEAGELDGAGIDILPTREARRGWLSGALLGRAGWTPLRPISIELEGGAQAPFIRDHFLFLPEQPYYTPPAVSGIVGASVVATFL